MRERKSVQASDDENKKDNTKAQRSTDAYKAMSRAQRRQYDAKKRYSQPKSSSSNNASTSRTSEDSHGQMPNREVAARRANANASSNKKDTPVKTAPAKKPAAAPAKKPTSTTGQTSKSKPTTPVKTAPEIQASSMQLPKRETQSAPEAVNPWTSAINDMPMTMGLMRGFAMLNGSNDIGEFNNIMRSMDRSRAYQAAGSQWTADRAADLVANGMSYEQAVSQATNEKLAQEGNLRAMQTQSMPEYMAAANNDAARQMGMAALTGTAYQTNPNAFMGINPYGIESATPDGNGGVAINSNGVQTYMPESQYPSAIQMLLGGKVDPKNDPETLALQTALNRQKLANAMNEQGLIDARTQYALSGVERNRNKIANNNGNLSGAADNIILGL